MTRSPSLSCGSWAEQIFDFSQLSLSAVGRVPPAEEYAQLLSP